MKLPPDFQFHENIRLLVYRPRGTLNEAAVNDAIRVIGEIEAQSKAPFNRFSDTLGLDDVELNFRYVINVSLYRRLSAADRPAIKSAILARDSTIIHYGSLLALLTQGSSINVRVFRDREEASQWLNVPTALMMPAADREK